MRRVRGGGDCLLLAMGTTILAEFVKEGTSQQRQQKIAQFQELLTEGGEVKHQTLLNTLTTIDDYLRRHPDANKDEIIDTFLSNSTLMTELTQTLRDITADQFRKDYTGDIAQMVPIEGLKAQLRVMDDEKKRDLIDKIRGHYVEQGEDPYLKPLYLWAVSLNPQNQAEFEALLNNNDRLRELQGINYQDQKDTLSSTLEREDYLHPSFSLLDRENNLGLDEHFDENKDYNISELRPSDKQKILAYLKEQVPDITMAHLQTMKIKRRGPGIDFSRVQETPEDFIENARRNQGPNKQANQGPRLVTRYDPFGGVTRIPLSATGATIRCFAKVGAHYIVVES